ncbi:hypothetical protein DFH08DRAFT_1088395 [Mycena albidolilacea]|uniref:Uncharacterized protein n=1 Tax=Mycena albidolilacea TaxID=1033008 RepID=A0AAD7EBQ8_9AGAR|nr:hypothetical protein DFH08DRAFT_1088395 [Mycena albidolilacea]
MSIDHGAPPTVPTHGSCAGAVGTRDGRFGSRQCDVPSSATTSSSTSPSSPSKRLIVLTSVAPVRRWCYAAFLVVLPLPSRAPIASLHPLLPSSLPLSSHPSSHHANIPPPPSSYLLFSALFVTLCYYTIFAPPWIFPPRAFHGADLLLQILRWQVVMGRVEGKEGDMSLVRLTRTPHTHIPHATAGRRTGQHIQLRALIGGRT